ncbi:ROK family protein [Blautia schinkii]|nr:ROK family protein [Blautia schinkii]
MERYVSIDIGGTAIKYGLIDVKGNILERFEMPTQAYKGGPAILEKTVGIVESFREKVHPAGVCISTAGMVDVEKGEIFYAAPLIPEYAGTNFKRTIEEKFRIPCEVENDVNCAGLAESVSGAAKGSSISLTLTVGTGIGGCIVINGEVFHGYSNSACEVGYMHMFDSDFQTLGAASILTRKVTERKGGTGGDDGGRNGDGGSNDSAGNKGSGGGSGSNEDGSGNGRRRWNGYAVFEAARKGDEICVQAIQEMTDVLGRGIANICYVLNPEVVVLGGGIMAQEDYLKDKIRASLDHYLVPSIAQKTTLRFARHRNDAGMLGAFYHFRGRHPLEQV